MNRHQRESYACSQTAALLHHLHACTVRCCTVYMLACMTCLIFTFTMSKPSLGAGAAVLQDGGNAVDAAVATALCQGVYNPQASGIGGGTFMMIRASNGSVEVIDARELAPAGASTNMYAGKPPTCMIRIGIIYTPYGLLASYLQTPSIVGCCNDFMATQLSRNATPMLLLAAVVDCFCHDTSVLRMAS